MAALAQRDIDAVEPDENGGFRQFLALNELQMFGEDGDLQFVRRSRRRPQQKRSGKNGAPGNQRRL